MSEKTKKLYRLEEGSVIGGVCAGLGEYLNIDPILIRLLWIIIFFAGGSGLLIYVIFWAVLPLKKRDESSKKKMSKEETENNINNSEAQEESNYFFAIFLILLGGVFLLNTTGIIDWNIWSVLWRFWPLLIVFAGLSLIAQDSKVFRTIVGIFAVFAFIIVILWSWGISRADYLAKNYDINLPTWVLTTERTPEVEDSITITSDEYEDIEKTVINIDMGIGDLMIENRDTDNILDLESRHFQNFGQPDLKTKFRNNRLDVDLEIGTGRDFFVFNMNRSPEYSLILGQREMPTDLILKLGAGRAQLDLEDYELEKLKFEVGAGQAKTSLADLEINELNMDVGAGQLSLVFNEGVQFDNKIEAKVGAGRIDIEIPKDFGYRVNGNIGVGAIELREKTFSGIGQNVEDFKSDNYDSAEYIIEFNIDVGVGKFVIK